MSVNKVLAYPAHQLDGKLIEPKVQQVEMLDIVSSFMVKSAA